MKIGIFCDSIISDYSNDSVYFLRGILAELGNRGHQVISFEKENNAPLTSITKEFGKTGINEFKRVYPHIDVQFYKNTTTADLKPLIKDLQVIIVHNSAENELLSALPEVKSPGTKILFYDTSLPLLFVKREELKVFDAVLVSGTKLKELYSTQGLKKVFLWQEGVDTRIFNPRRTETEGQVVLISNWTDEDRSAEIDEFLIQPVKYLRIKAKVFGSKYPRQVKKLLADAGIEYAAWAPSFKAPEIYSRFVTTIYMPGASSAPDAPLSSGNLLPLASGIPMISAGWKDQDKLLNKGRDFLFAKDGYEMKHYILEMMNSTLKEVITGHGIKSINSRHSVSHRLNELDKIFENLGMDKARQYSLIHH